MEVCNLFASVVLFSAILRDYILLVKVLDMHSVDHMHLQNLLVVNLKQDMKWMQEQQLHLKIVQLMDFFIILGKFVNVNESRSAEATIQNQERVLSIAKLQIKQVKSATP